MLSLAIHDWNFIVYVVRDVGLLYVLIYWYSLYGLHGHTCYYGSWLNYVLSLHVVQVIAVYWQLRMLAF